LKIDHNVRGFSHFQDTWKYLLPPACAHKFLTICKINVRTDAYLGVVQNLLSHALGHKPASTQTWQAKEEYEKEPHVLCYEHHVEMKIGRARPELRDESAETPLYACQEPGCLVHYASSRGYFIVAAGANATEREMEPRVRCPKDGQFMYLAKVEPAKRSFRLWKCPECAASHTNQEISSG